MNEIKRLQKLLSEGKIDQKEYKKQLKELLDNEEVTQDEFDEAEDFEPEGDDPKDKPIFSQNDVDSMIVSKARKLVRADLKKAGVDLNGIKGSELMDKLAEWAKNGQAAGQLDADEQELAELRRKAKAFDESQGDVKQLRTENAVLKAADTYKPHNIKQVIRALDDYDDYLDYDEDGNIDPKSVDRALKAVHKAEPNLFPQETDPGDGGDPGDDDLDGKQKGTSFSGKGPGRGTGGTGKNKQEQTVSAGLEMLGISKQK